VAEERVQRRLAAILAADVVGYSRLMGQDEAGTLARLKVLRGELIDPKVTEYGGRIVKTTGDGVLIEFPSAVDAVQHAVDIQGDMARRNADLPEERRIRFRIGINIGDVIVDGDDIFGDGVNVAARLEEIAEPGGISVSAMVFENVRNRLDVEFTDLGEQSVKNIADPVRIYRIGLRQSDRGAAASHPTDSMFRRPAMAVLPFQNLGGDPEQEYFADGLTEDIITALSLLHSFPVIARNSTFSYKGSSPDIRQVGRELGARYVLEGSVRRAGDRLRVTAQLINAETGHHVWAERYDRNLDDIFELQDEITHRIAATIEPELERTEARRLSAQKPADLGAWDFCQRGMAYLHEYSGTANENARAMFDQALRLDPDYAPAYVGMAYSHYRDVRVRYVDDLAESERKLTAAARRAVELDDQDAKAHWVMGCAYQIAGQWDLAIAEGRRSVELNPNFAYGYFALGGTYLFSGDPEAAIPTILKTFELNPKDPRNHAVLSVLARACLNAKRYEEAVDWARKLITLRADMTEFHLLLASGLGHLGRLDEAGKELEASERLHPGSTTTGLIGGAGSFILDNVGDEGDKPDPLGNAHYLEGLRKARGDGG